MLTASQEILIKEFNRNITWLKSQAAQGIIEKKPDWITISEAQKILPRKANWFRIKRNGGIVKGQYVQPELIKGSDWKRRGKEILYNRNTIQQLSGN